MRTRFGLGLATALLATSCGRHAPIAPSALHGGATADGSLADNIYAVAGANMLTRAAARARPLVYVPNSRGASVPVIDPASYRVVRTFRTGSIPQHVVPAYD